MTEKTKVNWLPATGEPPPEGRYLVWFAGQGPTLGGFGTAYFDNVRNRWYLTNNDWCTEIQFGDLRVTHYADEPEGPEVKR